MDGDDRFSGLNDEQVCRYARHIVLPEVGAKGQRKLLESSALVVGAGGLGSPAIQYLAAAGVGMLGIADCEVVELSNLQRQTIHAGRLGEQKAKSAAKFVRDLNTDVRVETHTMMFSPDNVMDIVGGYDVVLDCTDNFPTRFLLNDACVLARKPLCHGSLFRFEGQVTTILPFEGPCYRCFYREAPPPGMVPSCAESGVLGVVAGVIGALQATEAFKVILRLGKTLSGRILHYDALSLTFTPYPSWDSNPIGCDPGCPVCGETTTVTGIDPKNYDYENNCRIA